MSNFAGYTPATFRWVRTGRVDGRGIGETPGRDVVHVTQGVRGAKQVQLTYVYDLDILRFDGIQIEGVEAGGRYEDDFYEYLGVISQILRQGFSDHE